jgi:hypothetical protein
VSELAEAVVFQLEGEGRIIERLVPANQLGWGENLKETTCFQFSSGALAGPAADPLHGGEDRRPFLTPIREF